MLEEIRKGLLSGLGAIFLTRDKVENIVRNMVNEAKISSDDARKVLKGLDLCRRSELDNLQARVMELEQQLKEIDKQEHSPGDAV
jgi:polyhydroxyalkanoate synthesis regulator phasin